MTSQVSTGDTALRTETQIAAASEIDIFDAQGNTIQFGALFELEKTIVIFIRHFFCGRCQQYVSQLATAVRPEAFQHAGTKIVVIGCGDWLLINNYRELTCTTSNPLISFYADPTRHLYRAMGLTTESLATTPSGQPKRSYTDTGRWANTARSIVRALKHPLHVGKQGNISQLGGEFILGPGNTCSFAHNMQHTEDHADVPEIFEAAGVTYSYP